MPNPQVERCGKGVLYFWVQCSVYLLTESSATSEEFKRFALTVFPFAKVEEMHQVLVIQPNTELTTTSLEEVENNGYLGKLNLGCT